MQPGIQESRTHTQRLKRSPSAGHTSDPLCGLTFLGFKLRSSEKEREKGVTKGASVFCAKSLQGLSVSLALVRAAAPLRSVSRAERAEPGAGSRRRSGRRCRVLRLAGATHWGWSPGSSGCVPRRIPVASLRLSEAPPSAAGPGSTAPPLALGGTLRSGTRQPARALTPRHPGSLAQVAARPGPGLA